ncbi:MAG: dockerin type I domain-containing protein, partial [Candidatus Shapirobacteria bacterium]
DWRQVSDCSKTGQTCVGGACVAAPPKKGNGSVCKSNDECFLNKCFNGYCIHNLSKCNPYGGATGCSTNETCKLQDGTTQVYYCIANTAPDSGCTKTDPWCESGVPYKCANGAKTKIDSKLTLCSGNSWVGNDNGCTDAKGKCVTNDVCTGGTFVANKCLSPKMYLPGRCCVPNSIPTYTIYTKGSCNTSTGKYSCTSSTSTTAPNGSTTFSDKEKCEDYTGCNQTTYTIFTKGSCNTSTGNWVCTKNSASSTAANGTTTFSSEALCGAVTGCDIACTTANWTSALSPTTCPSTGKQTKTWTKTGTCTGGVTHPATETVDCDPGYTAPKLTMQVSMLGVFAGANDKCLDQQMKLKVNVSKAGDAGITREMIATKVDDKFSTVKVVNDGYQVYEIKDFELDNTYLLTDKIYIYVTNIKDSHLKLLTTLYGRNEQTGGFVSGDTSLIKVSDLVDKTLTLYNWSILNGDIDGNGSIDGFDFAAMKNEWNKEVATNGVLKSDLNGDCYVNGLDLQIYKNSLEKQFSAKSLN